MARTPGLKFVRWIGSARKDMRALPADVQHRLGFALYVAQCGLKHAHAKPMHGFGGAGVLEVVEDFDGESYRAIYTVKFVEAIYVLHIFQKKSRRGAETDQRDIDLVRARLKRAEADSEGGFG